MLEGPQSAVLLVTWCTTFHSAFQVAHCGLAAGLLHASDSLISLLNDEFVDDLGLLWCLLLPHPEDGAG